MRMENFILTFLLMMFTSCFYVTSGKYVQVKYMDKYIEVDTATCKDTICNNGLVCKPDCTGIQYCQNNQLCESKSCPDNFHCNPKTASCEDGSVDQFSCSVDYQFSCIDVGLFPDPFNCKQYYCCSEVGDKPEATPCPQDMTYDSVLRRCTLGARCGDPPVPTCRDDENLHHTQCDQISENNPYVVYVCVVDESGHYQPVLSNCDSGVYNVMYCNCTNTMASVKERVQSVSCNPSPTDTTTTTTIAPPPQRCPQAGGFYATSDTSHYCFCTRSLICDIRQCPPGTYFNSSAQRCAVPQK